ncbi:molybdenum cofactor biosynthesis protein MoaC [Algoriphagus alkaliphilus]|uniref:Molybdenum cofactor biosynthesis protein MoaC n=2 Tax=Algoriphagus alkaliphilus TaxID=279824 RepID=A0A1G5XGL7_9BACT|nr:molybdenum cofactor biosynthesis protein MoaC [Algoriphagus alkaliphilus]
MAKVAGLFAVKSTVQILPNSHPKPIEFTGIEYQIQDLEIHILVKVKSVCKSDLEMEALYGATIGALTIYDMLKPIDKGISILKIQSEERTQKISNVGNQKAITTALVVCSNAIYNGFKPDSAGQEILSILKA